MSKTQTDLLEVSDLLYSQLYHHSAQKVREVAERLPELEAKAAAYDQLLQAARAVLAQHTDNTTSLYELAQLVTR